MLCRISHTERTLYSATSLNIFVWAVALLCHAAATSFGGLFACRVFLGICEGAITPGFMIVTSMFYTRQEQSQRTGYWCTLFCPRAFLFEASLLTPDFLSPYERMCYYYAGPSRVWHSPH